MNQREQGYSLIEVVVAMASLSLIIFAFFEVTSLRGGLMERVRVASDLSEIMVANVNEVKWRGFSTLPKPGDCLARTYDRVGKFISETLISGGSVTCGTAAIANNVMEIYWRVTGPAGINGAFVPAGFLKLPKYKASIVQIEVTGRTRASPPGPSEVNLSALVFRK